MPSPNEPLPGPLLSSSMNLARDEKVSRGGIRNTSTLTGPVKVLRFPILESGQNPNSRNREILQKDSHYFLLAAPVPQIAKASDDIRKNDSRENI